MNETSVLAAIVTVSDTRVPADDFSGDALERLLIEFGAAVRSRILVTDDFGEIADALTSLSDAGIDLIVTTGGTGFSPRDNTPEATKSVVEREAPGLAELMRAETGSRNKKAYLSRGLCGIRKSSLIVNLPGSPAGVTECFTAVAPVLPHALRVLKGKAEHK